MFYVYVLQSLEDRGLYIGFSTNLKKRIAEHEHGASFATKYRGPWKLIYYEAYASEKGARLRERRLKHHGSGKAELKKRLINSLMSVSQIGAGRSEMGQPTV